MVVFFCCYCSFVVVVFSEKIRLYISCELSSMQMMYLIIVTLILFSRSALDLDY